jgi:hypothetical protein
MRYKLDDLGAYQFEELTQSLLKAHVGLSVESWGRRSDFGRDAYTPSALYFPNKNIETAGPFIFQVKFVEGATASGAKPGGALLGSVSKEITQIRGRKSDPKWIEPSHFTFLTNSPMGVPLREEVREKFKSILPDSVIITYGGDDICDFLDQPPSVCRSFPQLLGIRDLDLLIRNALTRASATRSLAAIDRARELVPVFAPTSGYERAWAVLDEHHFVVLEGPPEVGKSAIAWMIGLSQVGDGWDAVFCQEPREFFEMYDPSRRQVFIADDAFGHTEYDPTRASKWEPEIELVLHRLDSNHWLIWTSRRQILERAIGRMDLTGRARWFPKPGAVLVNVKSLSVEERALMLFRHARAANLESDVKNLVRRYAALIIKNADLTPERVRRFVSEGLPTLVAMAQSGTTSKWEISRKIDEAIRNPTKQMRLTFRGLPVALKWYLISMLDATDLEKTEKTYVSYCPDEKRTPFEEATRQLDEAFIHLRTSIRGLREGKYIPNADWIHPSYRDLVIDELAADPELRTQFLKRASLEGVKLAVSDTGGQEGLRRLPLMVSAESWEILEERALAIVRELNKDRDLLEIFFSAARESNSTDLRRRWERLISAVCRAIKGKWDGAAKRLEVADLAAFRAARSAINSDLEFPSLLSTWRLLAQKFCEELAAHPTFDEFDFRTVEELTQFSQEGEACIPGFLGRNGFPDQFESAVERMIEKARRASSALKYADEEEDREEFASDVSKLARALDRISRIQTSSLDGNAKRSFKKMDDWAIELEGMAHAFGSHEPDYSPSYEPGDDSVRDEGPSTDEFDIGGLFAEL